MKVFILCSKEVDTNKTALHSAYLDIEDARVNIENIREEDDDRYYYIETLKIDEDNNER